ncbi:NAD-dependent epimerase/dehydratase family protein [Paenibacillus psychroresistens]|uniref:NAD-dependent epimerase/dehydratase family protein n=1 Tax=Paenibacillus psychroresistens TaxID=1778678 RepID=A0A6B8RGR9_9BACL|nr:NAD-dependent epimerase/dehydratase family protein [Paenibacillus psychroresistens]QGQ94914.1 NAD-dependent epimerase/dehydratase family protein [Paenibacillus psychroresistens]
MRILVTGGAGFIASNIVDALIDEGHEVSVLDNLSTGKRANIHPNAPFYLTDITERSVQMVFEQCRPEIVIHHAAQIDVQTSLHNPLLDAKVNIIGTINLLEQCKSFGVKKIIYASSAAVYGHPNYLGVDEKHALQPISFYGISKHTPEHYIQAYGELFGLDYTILRYSNVYGIRQDPRGEGGVISIFLNRLLHEETPIIYGNGENTRDFIYVKDIVSANIAALIYGSHSLYNISCNQQISLNNLLKQMNAIIGSNVTPQYVPARQGDILHSRLDNQKALKQLQWLPQYSIEKGLTETYHYYKACL